MFSKSLIQFSINGWGCVPFLLFDLRPNYGEDNEDDGDLLQHVPCIHCSTQCPWPCSGTPLTHTSARDSWSFWVSLGQSLVGSLLLSPESWCTRFCCALPESVSQSCVCPGGSAVGVNGDIHPEGLCHTQVCSTQSPYAGHCWPAPPQETLRHRSGSVSMGGEFVVCPSWVWAAQAARCLGEHCPRRAMASLTSPVSCSVSREHRESAVSGVLCVFSQQLIWEAVTFLADVNPPGYQGDVVSSWEPACSLVEDAISGAEIAPRFLALAVARLPVCLLAGWGWSAAGQLSFGVCSVLCSVRAKLCIRLLG